MTNLFKARCVAPDRMETILEAALDRQDNASPYDRITFRVGPDSQDAKTFTLEAPVTDTGKPFEARLKLDQGEAAALFGDLGLIGLKPSGQVVLEAVRIVVRPAAREGGHSSEHPFFALYLDWAFTAQVDQTSKLKDVEVTGAMEARLTLTTGFSSIHPPDLAVELGARSLQVRLDLDFLAATTGWVALSAIEGGSGSAFDMPGLLEWFRRLVGQGGGGELADWRVDLRLDAALPLGLRFDKSYLALKKEESGYSLQARATGLVLTWKGTKVFQYEKADFFLVFAAGKYSFKVTLLEAQYPASGANGPQEPWAVELPLGTLALKAEAWRVTAGLVAVRQGSGPISVCPEIIVEMAGVSLFSKLWSDGEPIWRSSAARLHLRRLRVLTCAVPEDRLLFGDIVGDNWLNGYRDTHKPHVGRLSGVAAARKGESQDSFPLEFLDGAFDRESHLFLLWKQDNGALFDRFAQIIPGLASGRPGATGSLVVGFELARFGGPAGRDLQARLEWRPVAAALDGGPAETQPPQAAPASGPICSHKVGETEVLNLPSGGATPPQDIQDADLRLDLPLIEVAIARPSSRSLLFYRPAGEQPVLSLLHIYRKAADEAVRPILYAAIDLSLEQDGERELLPTGPTASTATDAPCIAMGLGTTEAVKALAIVTWAQGERPQVMRAFEGGTQGFEPLIPATLPTGGGDCTGCPEPPAPRRAPLALRPDRFGAPNVATAANGWAFAVQVAARRALRSFFAQSQSGGSLIEFDIEKVCYEPDDAEEAAFLPPLRIHTRLTVRLDLDGAGAESLVGTAVFRFDPSDMSLRLVEGGVFDFEMAVTTAPDWARQLEFPVKPDDFDYSKPLSLFGLEATFYRPKVQGAEKARFLTLDLRGGRFALGLAEGARCALRYTDLGGGALTFEVAEFLFGPGGLDVEAALVPSPLKVKGLSAPFQLESAQLSMKGSRMRRLSVSASGKLPEILSSAPVAVTISLSQPRAGAKIDLDELSCELTNQDEPIFTAGLRYRFEITALSLRYAREASGAGGRHFFFEVTGSAQFQPEAGEFDGGLLENLRSARVEFTRAPLSDEFTDHLTFIVELNEPVTFDVFKIFRMEIRSFGFAPKYDFPGGEPRAALIIGGQCEFADIGDVVSAEIDFHRMYIGLPARGRSRPQIDFKNLRVEIRSAEGFRIGGTVASMDDDKVRGFKGDGFVAIPGFPQLGAAFAFTELRLADGKWKRAWFIALEASAISYQIAPLPIFLRHVGLGFGYRYTSVLLREQPQDQTLAELVDHLLAALDQHQTLARIESWVEDPETSGPPRWSIAMEGVLTLGTTQPDPFTYKPKDEQKLRTVVLQMLAAMNTNGLVAGAKLWFPVSFDDFLVDRLDMRRRPMAKGFVHFSPRKQRLLTYARKEKNAYYGPPDDPLTNLAKTILEPVPYEYAALVEPGRVRGEIGWADRLVFQLQVGLLKLECRGGILYAVEKGTAVFGIYFSARGGLGLSGGAGGGSLGLRVSAHAEVKFATRLMIAQPLLKPLGSSVYAQIGLDINVRFSVDAWFKFKVGFVKVHLSVRFSISLQVLVALEIGMSGAADLGFKARATVVIGVFGRRLHASIAVGVNDGAVENARQTMQPFMSSMLEPGKIPPVPGSGSQGILEALPAAAALTALPTMFDAVTDPLAGEAGLEAAAEDFAFAVIPAGPTLGAGDGERRWLLWIMPTPRREGFYPVPRTPTQKWATLSNIPEGTRLSALNSEGKWVLGDGGLDLFFRGDKFFAVEAVGETPSPQERLTLHKAFAGCYRPGNTTGRNFPFDFVPEDVLNAVWAAPADKVLEDDRIAEGPRHVDPALNPASNFDAALAAEIKRRGESEKPDPQRDLEEQALGNQAFLLTSFQEHIDAYVEKAGAEPLNSAPANQPSVWDTGMVLLLEAAELPEWVRKRGATGRPILKFVACDLVGTAAEHELQPLVEPEAALVSDGKIRLAEPPVAHFDEELLALSWKVDWRDGPPPAADGISREVDDFLRYYRIELFDLAGSGGGNPSGRPVVQRLNKRVNFLARIPKDPLAPQGEARLVELRRYGFTIAVDELFPKRPQNDQTLRQLLAVITPVGQAGEEGEPFSMTATQELRLTPLPADEAELELVETAQGFAARLSWREPALPNRAAIAATDQWELILRKLPRVPLGHYPEAAAAASDESATLAFDREVRPGDLIVRIEKPSLTGGLGDDGRRIYKLSLHDGLTQAGFLWLDHDGKKIPVEEDARLQRLKKSFLERVSAARTGGHAWQIFLRARHGKDAVGGPATYSSLASVRMFARIAPRPGSSGSAAAADETGRKLPLLHFEWPEQAVEVGLPAPTVAIGPHHVPLVDFVGGERSILYCPSGDKRRVVSSSWSGFLPAPRTESAPALPACAGFRLFEAREDALSNRDNADPANPTKAAMPREIAVFDAIDAGRAGANPDTLAETQNWLSWSPAQRSILTWLQRVGPAAPSVSTSAQSAWYSWSDADLVWPDPLHAQRPALDAPEAAPKVLPRANLHPLLAELLVRLKRDWADPEGFILEAAAGKPDVSAGTPFEWMSRDTEALDPHGWAALWHLGLAVELSARDAVSGEGVPQAPLIAKCEVYLADMLTQPHFAALAGHVALDCPLRPNAGLAAVSAPGPLDSFSLYRIQVALRPIPRRLDQYCVVDVSRQYRRKVPAAAPAPSPSPDAPGLYVLRLDDSTDQVGFIDLRGDDESIRVALVKQIRPGTKLLLKLPADSWIRLRPLIEAIAASPDESQFERVRIEPGPAPRLLEFVSVQRPMSLETGEAPISIWPHGRFGYDEKGTSPTSSEFSRFLDYLVAAPLAVKAADTAEDGTRRSAPGIPPEEKEQIRVAYRGWARRFFASAPTWDGMPPAPFRFSNANSATAAPRSEVVDVLAPSRDGTYHFNRIVDWQWATSRSLSVLGVGRYDGLLRRMRPHSARDLDDVPARIAGAARPFYLPRIRKLEPPQLLGERIVRAEDGRDYHELVLASHDEDALQQANIAAERQLEFIGEWLRLRREFRFVDWVTKLRVASQGISPGLSSPPRVWIDEPLFTTSDATLLASVPAIRFGGSAKLFLCEPYFYSSVAELWATCTALESNPVETRLANPSAAQPLPDGDVPLSAAKAVLPWDEPLKARYALWLAAFGELPGAIEEAMNRWELVISVRFPRYFESLRGESRTVESKTGTVGALPDNEAAVTIFRASAGAEEPICLLRANDQPGSPVFDLQQLSPDLPASLDDVSFPGWDKGIWLKLRVRLSSSGPSAEVGDGFIVADLPLALAQEELLYEPRRLPAWGTLAAMAPLALRLVLRSAEGAESAMLRVEEPFPFARFMLRPLTVAPHAARQPSPGDVALGLRLLIDTERMAAAKASVYGVRYEPQTALGAAVEEAVGVALRKRPTDGISQSQWSRWRDSGLTVWGRRQTEAGATWVRLDDPPESGIELLIAWVSEWTVASEQEFGSFLAFDLADQSATRWDVSAIKSAGHHSLALGRELEPQIERARRLDPDVEGIAAWAQRGNDQRSLWGDRRA